MTAGSARLDAAAPDPDPAEWLLPAFAGTWPRLLDMGGGLAA